MWPFFRKKKNVVRLGGEWVEVKPLTLPRVIELSLLLAPYWPVLEAESPTIDKNIRRNSKPVLMQIFLTLRESMLDTPGDITKVVAILAGVDPVWLATNGTAIEILGALPILDRVHNFKRLWRVVRQGSNYLIAED